MAPLRDEIHRAVISIAQKWKDETNLLPKGLLPLDIRYKDNELDAHNEGQLDTYVAHWLTSEDSAVAILTAPLGGGKTMATCMLPELLNQETFLNKNVLWIPLRDTDFLFSEDPDETIIKLLSKHNRLQEPVDIWSRNAGIDCIILDGLDEALYASRDNNQVKKWLSILLRRAQAAVTKPRILISGRDVILERSVIDRQLFNHLQSFCNRRSLLVSQQPLQLHLREWKDEEIRTHLEGELKKDWGIDTASKLMDMVRPGILTSPLLFGLAYEVLTEIAETQDKIPKVPTINNEWELISNWIRLIIARDMDKYTGNISEENRRKVAQEIALFLCLLAQEKTGVEIAEIRQKLEDYGLISIGQELFEYDDFELKVACLLRERNGCFSIFHDVILMHLAAEALERLVQNHQDLEIKTDNLTQNRIPFLNELSQLVERPGIPKVIGLMRIIIEHKAIQNDCSFPEVLDYWIRYKWNLSNISSSQLPSFSLTNTLHHDLIKSNSIESNRLYSSNSLTLEKEIDPIREIIVLMRNAILRNLDINEQNHEAPILVKNIIYENQENDIPVIVIAKDVIINIEVENLLENCIKQNITTPIEQGISDKNNITFYLPNSTQFQAIKILKFIAQCIDIQDVIPNNNTYIENRKFRNYLIHFLNIQVDIKTPMGLEIENIPSTTPIQLIVEQIVTDYSEDIGLNYLDYQDLRVEVFLVNHDGTMSQLDPKILLEEYQICTGDILIIILQNPDEHIPSSQGQPPLSPFYSGVRIIYRASNFASTDSESLRSAISIPSGSIPIWEINKDGNRQITTINISQNIYIAKELVSVKDYADFLRANSKVQLPNQPEANWQRLNDQIIYTQELEDFPVTGISRSEAQAYTKWLMEENAESNTPSSNYLYQLPKPEWLQTATLGNQLEDPSGDGSGPYGHQNITGACWQWTEGNDGQEALAFGGSQTLGNDIEGGVQKALMRAYPDFCRRISAKIRYPEIGFRICLVDLGENSDE